MKIASPHALRLLLGIFVLSGFSGLIYESVWAQYLKLFLGHAAYAQTVVLVVFIGGMAIGAAVCGRFARRVSDPLLAYAAVEFAIGIAGVAFHWVFIRMTGWGYDVLLPLACAQEGACPASWVFAAVMLLPQSVLLGATFPLMVSGMLRADREHQGRRISQLYFLNSLGAVVGVLVGTFALVPAWGLPGATLTAGLVNIAIAIAVYELRRHVRASVPPPAASADSAYGTRSAVRLLIVVSAITGLSSFIYEILWIRMLSLVLGASTHAFELMLATFILGLALGGFWIQSRIDRIGDAWRFLGRVQLLMGACAAATLVLYNYCFDFMAYMLGALARSDPGYLLYHAVSVAISMGIMLPATLLAGMTLPLITLLLLRTSLGERSVGYVYAANTVGAIVGVLASVHVLMPMLGLRAGMVLASAIDVVLGIVLLRYQGGRVQAHMRREWAIAASAVLAVTAIGMFGSFDPWRTASGVFRTGQAQLRDQAEIVFHRDGKTATVDVLKHADGIVAIRTNGKTDAAMRVTGDGRQSGDEQTMTLLGSLPLAYRPQAKDFAVIGFGSGMSTSTILASPDVRSVETIEIEPAMVEGARAFLPVVEPAYTDPRSRIVIDDAKAHFARTGRTYDVIVSEPSNPWVSGVSSLFTEEFYERVKKQLAPDGILVQWLHVYEFDTQLLASIMMPLGAVFEDYVVYRSMGADVIVVASARGKVGEPSSRVFELPLLAARLARADIHSLADLEMRRVSGRNIIDQYLWNAGAPANSDFFPYVDLRAARTRFTHDNASAAVRVTDGPMPVVEMLEKRPFPVSSDVSVLASPDARHRRAMDAQRWATYLLGARPGDRKSVDGDGLLEESVALTRAVLVDCLAPEAVPATWDRLVMLAAEINPVLDAQRARAVWRTLATTPCAKRLDARQRSWLELFEAVAARDAERMSALSARLLDGRTTSVTQLEYLYTAWMTGDLVLGKREQVRRTWSLALEKLPGSSMRTPWMQLTYAWAQDPF